jgi:ATP-dependent Clp protease ATP-binding subunit ClpC
MFERFTDRARRLIVQAQEEARTLGHNYIGTEHLLLALIQEREEVAGRVLAAAGADLETARAEVERLLAEYRQRAAPDAEGRQGPGADSGNTEA